MIDQIKKAIQQIENLPVSKQKVIARLIEDELSWDATFEQTQEKLSALAKEALEEYKKGKTSDQAW